MKTLGIIIVITTLAFLAARFGEYWVCGKCGAQNSVYTLTCKQCGNSK